MQGKFRGKKSNWEKESTGSPVRKRGITPRAKGTSKKWLSLGGGNTRSLKAGLKSPKKMYVIAFYLKKKKGGALIVPRRKDDSGGKGGRKTTAQRSSIVERDGGKGKIRV